MCVGVIFGKLFKHHDGCEFSDGRCPLDKYTPLKKIDFGDSKLEIENRWKEININNGK